MVYKCVKHKWSVVDCRTRANEMDYLPIGKAHEIYIGDKRRSGSVGNSVWDAASSMKVFFSSL